MQSAGHINELIDNVKKLIPSNCVSKLNAISELVQNLATKASLCAENWISDETSQSQQSHSFKRNDSTKISNKENFDSRGLSYSYCSL